MLWIAEKQGDDIKLKTPEGHILILAVETADDLVRQLKAAIQECKLEKERDNETNPLP